jgi:hypothetical protein
VSETEPFTITLKVQFVKSVSDSTSECEQCLFGRDDCTLISRPYCSAALRKDETKGHFAIVEEVRG